MRSHWGVFLLPCLFAGVEAVDLPAEYTPKFKVIRNGIYPLDVVDKLEEATMPKVDAWMNKKIAAGQNNNCTLETAAVRREWSDLSVKEREEYVAAVQCLMKLPARADKKDYPGAISRFDDFVAFHMTRAPMLHDTIHLFASHKYFIWAYEQALRNECGYKGYQPYMNYDRYAQDPIHSPMFNGNASSMGSNGAPDPNYKGISQPALKPNLIKSGGAGGCVTEGPFKDMVVSLGPKSASVDNVPPNPRADGLGANPRCLRRDVNVNSALGATANYSYSLIMDYPQINGFYNRYLGQPPLRNDNHPWGLHIAGHYIHAGDPGGDFFCSPGDPVFYFHHGMLDRLWWIWQMQDPENRVTGNNSVPSLGRDQAPPPPGHNHGTRSDQAAAWKFDVSAEDPSTAMIDLEWLAPKVKLMDVNDQLGGAGGALCYVYV